MSRILLLFSITVMGAINASFPVDEARPAGSSGVKKGARGGGERFAAGGVAGVLEEDEGSFPHISGRGRRVSVVSFGGERVQTPRPGARRERVYAMDGADLDDSRLRGAERRAQLAKQQARLDATLTRFLSSVDREGSRGAGASSDAVDRMSDPPVWFMELQNEENSDQVSAGVADIGAGGSGDGSLALSARPPRLRRQEQVPAPVPSGSRAVPRFSNSGLEISPLRVSVRAPGPVPSLALPAAAEVVEPVPCASRADEGDSVIVTPAGVVRRGCEPRLSPRVDEGDAVVATPAGMARRKSKSGRLSRRRKDLVEGLRDTLLRYGRDALYDLELQSGLDVQSTEDARLLRYYHVLRMEESVGARSRRSLKQSYERERARLLAAQDKPFDRFRLHFCLLEMEEEEGLNWTGDRLFAYQSDRNAYMNRYKDDWVEYLRQTISVLKFEVSVYYRSGRSALEKYHTRRKRILERTPTRVARIVLERRALEMEERQGFFTHRLARTTGSMGAGVLHPATSPIRESRGAFRTERK